MKQLTKNIIDAVSLETGIAPSYIEKDWYLVLVLSLLQQNTDENVRMVFAGGTSLSKGYKLISRFSEDVDFSIIGMENGSRKQRSQFRDQIISNISSNSLLNVDKDTLKTRDECRYVNFYIDYPKETQLESHLRNNLKMELSFKPTYLPPEKKEIKSFVSEFIEDSPSVIIDCIQPTETAANKFSALMWRVDIKDRSQPNNHMTNDPSLMRHLHDLAALYPIISENKEFINLTKTIYEKDKQRGDKNRNMLLNDFICKTLTTLKIDTMYRSEYETFVASMNYGNEKISFDDAINLYEKICNQILVNL